MKSVTTDSVIALGLSPPSFLTILIGNSTEASLAHVSDPCPSSPCAADGPRAPSGPAARSAPRPASVDCARTGGGIARCLPQALGSTPVLYRAGCTDLSFDEAWLLRLAAAAEREDADSFSFLLRSRVVPMHRRNMGFLAAELARLSSAAADRGA